MLWVIYSEDHDDGLPIRKANRDAHLAYAAGFDLVSAGPILDDDGEMRGSLVIIDAPTREDVEAYVANDPYTAAGLAKYTRIWAFRQTLGAVSLSP